MTRVFGRAGLHQFADVSATWCSPQIASSATSPFLAARKESDDVNVFDYRCLHG